MSGPTRLVVKPCAGMTEEQGRDLRARAWRYIFDCYERQKAADVTGIDGDDGKEIKNAPAKGSVPDRL